MVELFGCVVWADGLFGWVSCLGGWVDGLFGWMGCLGG